MYDSRKTDLKDCTKYRTKRFIRNGGEWFFSTREGTMEGPFGFKHESEDRLEIYKRVMASGFMPGDSKLALDPLEIEEK